MEEVPFLCQLTSFIRINQNLILISFQVSGRTEEKVISTGPRRTANLHWKDWAARSDAILNLGLYVVLCPTRGFFFPPFLRALPDVTIRLQVILGVATPCSMKVPEDQGPSFVKSFLRMVSSTEFVRHPWVMEGRCIPVFCAKRNTEFGCKT